MIIHRSLSCFGCYSPMSHLTSTSCDWGAFLPAVDGATGRGPGQNTSEPISTMERDGT